MSSPSNSSNLLHGRIPWRTNLILIPGSIVIASLVLFAIAQVLDRAQFQGSIHLPSWVNQGGAGDCRDLVSATAGAIITTLGLVLSITVLIFSTAATQFGQRLLRRYMRDRGTQICIGIFAATFVFALLTLLSVYSPPGERQFVPWVSAWSSLLLALSCVGTLIYFMHHVAVLIQVNTVLLDIRNDVVRVLDTLRSPHKRPLSAVPTPATAPLFSLAAPQSGYFQRIDADPLAEAARQAGVLVEFVVRPGHFVLQGAPIAYAKALETKSAPSQPPPHLLDVFARSVVIGHRRTMRQDPKFAILQIVEIGLRAMSPAVNDPFTMISCIDTLSASLLHVLQSSPIDPVHLDSSGQPRIVEPAVSFEKLANAGFDPIRQICHDSVATTIRIFTAITALAPFAKTTADLNALEHQADLTKEGFISDLVSKDANDMQAAYSRAKSAISFSRSHPF